MGNSLCAGHAAAVVTTAAAAADSGAKHLQQQSAKPLEEPPPADDIERALRDARAELDRAAAAGRLLQESSSRAATTFSAAYELGKVIGHGAFSRVQLCSHLVTGELRAVKVVAKLPDSGPKQREAVIREVAIMRLLGDHPNAVTLHEVFEDEAAYHLVMELCAGGELFDQLVTRRQFSEGDAAALLRPLLDFVAYAHSKHVVHRDLKPENLLLTSKDSAAQLRVIDFGTSDFCRPGQRLTQKYGTPYYVAPEVLGRSYGPAVDVWSAGVILYILLCGVPPFGGSSDARILERVARGAYSFAAKEWEGVSGAAKSLVSAMLVLDEGRRARAADLLQHPWFSSAPQQQQQQQRAGQQRGRSSAAASATDSAAAAALGAHIVRRLRGFAAMSHMQRLALKVMARLLSDADVSRLRALFMSMDSDHDGAISPLDLHTALQQVGAVVGEGELAELFRVSDLSGQPGGAIDYEEFLAAMLDSRRVAARVDAVRTSFETFDRDGDGVISVEDMAQVLQDEQPAMKEGAAGRRRSLQLAQQLVTEVDVDKDGSISFAEFQSMWGPHTEPVAA